MAALGKLDDLLLRLVEASGHPMHAQNEWRHSMNRTPVTPSFYPSGQYVFTVSPGTAIGARTLVRRKVGWRKGIAIPQRGSAGRAFLRDKSRAPCQSWLARSTRTMPAALCGSWTAVESRHGGGQRRCRAGVRVLTRSSLAPRRGFQ